jgi:hypothetical protein
MGLSKIVVIPDEGIPEEDKAVLRTRFEREACRWCGGLHQRECPRVKKIIYNPSDDRVVREVEFWKDEEWNHSVVLWPEDVV